MPSKGLPKATPFSKKIEHVDMNAVSKKLIEQVVDMNAVSKKLIEQVDMNAVSKKLIEQVDMNAFSKKLIEQVDMNAFSKKLIEQVDMNAFSNKLIDGRPLKETGVDRPPPIRSWRPSGRSSTVSGKHDRAPSRDRFYKATFRLKIYINFFQYYIWTKI
jgi:hypothetical protein